MRDLGYVEGENIVIEGRYYGDRLDRVPAFAAELARSQVDVIVAAAHRRRRQPGGFSRIRPSRST
jgi:hypothetical protein